MSDLLEVLEVEVLGWLRARRGVRVRVRDGIFSVRPCWWRIRYWTMHWWCMEFWLRLDGDVLWVMRGGMMDRMWYPSCSLYDDDGAPYRMDPTIRVDLQDPDSLGQLESFIRGLALP